jgi:hypothetical protein
MRQHFAEEERIESAAEHQEQRERDQHQRDQPQRAVEAPRKDAAAHAQRPASASARAN